MKFQSLTTILAASTTATSAALPKAANRCEKLSKRIEWRELDPKDQQGYINAVLCLKTKSSRIGLKGSLYDDFSHVHFDLNNFIHNGAPFLPWHRYFSKVYETALRDDCGYDGPGTYWDWTLDNEGLRFSPVMADNLGFGGNGDTNAPEINPEGGGRDLKCVSDGPFKNLRPEYLAISPTEVVSGGHCLFRDLPEVSEPQAFQSMRQSFSAEGVNDVLSSGNWSTFHTALEGGPHGVIHASLGGEMNPTTSPNEPLFFLHHAQIDRLWWMWQQEDGQRQTEYSGEAQHFGEEGSRQVRLDDVLPMKGLAKDLKIEDVMDTSSEHMCLTY